MLKPCPFCVPVNEDVVLGTTWDGVANQFYIYCTKCCTEGPHAATAQQADANWNQRSDEDGERFRFLIANPGLLGPLQFQKSTKRREWIDDHMKSPGKKKP